MHYRGIKFFYLPDWVKPVRVGQDFRIGRWCGTCVFRLGRLVVMRRFK